MSGIVCAGHWVLDHIKFIDNWPNLAESCNILSELRCNGGAPFNVLADLANLKVNIPTYGIGCIGNDKNSQHVLEICKEKDINIDWLHILDGETTSYTDVTTIKSNGIRTMFHFHGANSKFSLEHVAIPQLKEKKIKLFYLGHLLLMDALEQYDAQYKIGAARLLANIQETGMETVIDVVTEKDEGRYHTVVKPCLPYVDHLVINELEAQRITGIELRRPDMSFSKENIKQAAHDLLMMGVNKNVVIHLPEGAYWLNKAEQGIWHPSLNIPEDSFIATCGAGDAFCSGILVGIHEGWNREKSLQLAVSTAAASITSSHNSDGIQPIQKTLQLCDIFGIREPVEQDC